MVSCLGCSDGKWIFGYCSIDGAKDLESKDCTFHIQPRSFGLSIKGELDDHVFGKQNLLVYSLLPPLSCVEKFPISIRDLVLSFEVKLDQGPVSKYCTPRKAFGS